MFSRVLNVLGSFLCVFLLTFSVMANATQKLTIWYSYQDSHFLTTIIKHFEKDHDVTITPIQFDPDKIKAELLLAAQYGGLPDMVVMPSDFIGLHHLMKLKSIPENWFTQPMSKLAKKTVEINDHVWGLPLIQGNFLMLYYNKKLVRKPITTWLELINEKQQFLAKGIKPIGWNYDDMFYFMPFLSAFDGWPIVNNKFTLNTPQMAKALLYYRGLAQQGIVDKTCDYSCSQIDFLQGKLAYTINGDWAYREFKQELGDNLGITLLPKVKGNNMHPMSSTYVLSFPSYHSHIDKKRTLLKDFALFVQRPEIQNQIYKDTLLLPVDNVAFAQVKREAVGDEHTIFNQLMLSKPMPSSIKMSIAWQAITMGYQRFQDGMPAKEAAEYMQKVALEQLKRLE